VRPGATLESKIKDFPRFHTRNYYNAAFAGTQIREQRSVLLLIGYRTTTSLAGSGLQGIANQILGVLANL
jgi:hypothetical protein